MVEVKEFANLVGEYVETQIKSESDLIPLFKIYLKASEKYRAAYIEDVLKSTEPSINNFAKNLISLDEFVKSV